MFAPYFMANDECECCAPISPIVDCGCTTTSGCTLDTRSSVRSQMIIDLPAVSHTGSGRFNHAGGEFLVEWALTTPAGGFPQTGIGLFPCCNLFGAVIGTECGDEVIPFISFGYVPAAVGSDIAVGYMINGTGASAVIYAFSDPVSNPPTGTYVCTDMDYSWPYSGSSTSTASDCSFVGGKTRVISAHTIRILSV